jgi:hypothetical protein
MPFTADQFFDVFRAYNEAVWPSPLAFIIAAFAVILVAFRDGAYGGRLPAVFLAVVWLWMGVVYHALFFRAINPAAIVFAALFVLQACLFVWFGVVRRRLTFDVSMNAAGTAGAVLLTYALAIYPALSHLLGHRYPEAPTFGLPCPTTIFTFGLLLWVGPKVPRVLLIIPALWSVVGTVAALQLGMWEDYGLAAAAVIATAILLFSGRSADHRIIHVAHQS